MKASERNKVLSTLENLRDEIREAGVSDACVIYDKIKNNGVPLVKELVNHGLLKENECIWMPIFGFIIDYAPPFFDRETLDDIEPVLRQSITFLKSGHSDIKTDWDFDLISRKKGLLDYLAGLFGDIAKSSDGVIQSEFIKAHAGENPEADISFAFFLWDKSKHVNRAKQGHSYKVTATHPAIRE